MSQQTNNQLDSYYLVFPKSGGVWILEIYDDDDESQNNVEVYVQLMSNLFQDIRLSVRRERRQLLEAAGGTYYARPAQNEFIHTFLHERGFSIPSDDEIPDDWPTDWRRTLDQKAVDNNVVLGWFEPGVYVADKLSATAAIVLRERVLQIYYAASRQILDGEAKSIEAANGIYFANPDHYPGFVNFDWRSERRRQWQDVYAF
jgi:hypothetical protein